MKRAEKRRRARSREAPPARRDPVQHSRSDRSEERNAAARATLQPLAPGERPRVVTVAAVVAAVLVLNSAGSLAWSLSGSGPVDERAVTLQALFLVLLVVIALGMWRAQYWAVLGMQALLAILIIALGTGLLLGGGFTVDSLIVIVGIVASGTLFWFLVKAMARLQMPSTPVNDPRPPAREPRA